MVMHEFTDYECVILLFFSAYLASPAHDVVF